MERIQDILQASLICRVLMAVGRWFGTQWENSRVVQAFLTPSATSKASSRNSVFSGFGRMLHRLLSLVYDRLGLERVFQGSIFGWLWLWCVLPVVLAPVLPTMAAAGLEAVACCAALLRLARERERRLAYASINKYILLYAVIYLVGTFFSVTPAGSLNPGLLAVFFTLYPLVLEGGLETRRQLERAVELMVLAGVVVSLYGIVQYVFRLGYNSSSWVDDDMFSSIRFRVSSTLQNPNMLGQYLLLIIPLGGACLLNARDWKRRILWLVSCGLMCLCMILTQSRGAWLGLVIAGVLFFAMLEPRLLLLTPFALAAMYFVLPASVIQRFTSIGNLADGSSSFRRFIWMGTLNMLKDYWMCGIGPGEPAFRAVYPRYAFHTVAAPHSHNLLLQITCDAGICALVVFCLILFWYFKDLSCALHREKELRGRLWQIAFFTGGAGFMVQAMTDYSFYNYRVMLLFWGYLALGAAAARWKRLPEGGAA